MGKNSKITNIVRLRQLLSRRRIRPMGSSSPSPMAIDVPARHAAAYAGRWRWRFVMKATHLKHPAFLRLRQMLRRRRIRAMGSSSPSLLPNDVPAGHVAVYVGRWSRRFVMKATHLNHPAFLNLLRQAEKEYGFSQPGPLCLPCDESVFLQTLRQISPAYAFRFAIAEDLDFPVSRYFCCCRARSKRRFRKTA